jgi:hypothetical protein
VIYVQESDRFWPEESQCYSQEVTWYDRVEPTQWRHLNVFSKECVIVGALPQRERKGDRVIYRVTPPGEGQSKHFTKKREAFALMLVREIPVEKVSEILEETDRRMWRMVWVGAAQMNCRKEHNYMTVFADFVFGVEGKGAEVWASFAGKLQAHNGYPKAIRPAAIHMSLACIRGLNIQGASSGALQYETTE